MDILVDPAGTLTWTTGRARCALGKGGVSGDKREGDGATPVGCFEMKRVLYRADRGGTPETALPVRAIRPTDGWCDDPADSRYNLPVQLPYPARHERLWRDDGLYDIVVVLGHNDAPVVAGAGSAIFLHVARADYAPTEGCVAVAVADLRALLKACRPGDRLCVPPPA